MTVDAGTINMGTNNNSTMIYTSSKNLFGNGSGNGFGNMLASPSDKYETSGNFKQNFVAAGDEILNNIDHLQILIDSQNENNIDRLQQQRTNVILNKLYNPQNLVQPIPGMGSNQRDYQGRSNFYNKNGINMDSNDSPTREFRRQLSKSQSLNRAGLIMNTSRVNGQNIVKKRDP